MAVLLTVLLTASVLGGAAPAEQPWNADMSLLKLGSWYILDGKDYSLKSTIDVAQTDSRWSSVDPDIMY